MAFLKTSRYAQQATVEAPGPRGGTVTALTLRTLPPTAGDPYCVHDDDRLDLVANRSFGDATQFWRIADANSELDARRLIEPGREIDVPPTA